MRNENKQLSVPILSCSQQGLPPIDIAAYGRALLPPVFTLTAYWHISNNRRFFSVALSVDLRLPALPIAIFAGAEFVWSPDFPLIGSISDCLNHLA